MFPPANRVALPGTVLHRPEPFWNAYAPAVQDTIDRKEFELEQTQAAIKREEARIDRDGVSTEKDQKHLSALAAHAADLRTQIQNLQTLKEDLALELEYLMRDVLVPSGLPGQPSSKVVKQYQVEKHFARERLNLAVATVDNIRDGGVFGPAAMATTASYTYAVRGQAPTAEEYYFATFYAATANQAFEHTVKSRAETQASTNQAVRKLRTKTVDKAKREREKKSEAKRKNKRKQQAESRRRNRSSKK